MSKDTILEVIQGGIGATVFTVPVLSFSTSPSVQFAVTVFIGLYGTAINVLGKEKITFGTCARVILVGGFTSCMIWLGGKYMGLDPILIALMSGAIAYSGDKKFKQYINKFLERNLDK
jgi:hypothetical protein